MGIGGTLWHGAKDDESIRALHRAVDLGLTLSIPALVYVMGTLRLVGQVMKERKEELYVASKFLPKRKVAGTIWNDAARSISHDHIIKSTERFKKTFMLIPLMFSNSRVDDDWTRMLMAGCYRQAKGTRKIHSSDFY